MHFPAAMPALSQAPKLKALSNDGAPGEPAILINGEVYFKGGCRLSEKTDSAAIE